MDDLERLRVAGKMVSEAATVSLFVDDPNAVLSAAARRCAEVGATRFVDVDFPTATRSWVGAAEQSCGGEMAAPCDWVHGCMHLDTMVRADCRLERGDSWVQQGDLGNCWLLQVLLVVAHDGDVRPIFCTQESATFGFFAVRLFWPTLGTWVVMLLDDALPVDPSTRAPLHCVSTPDNASYAMLEKAFAKVHGGYWSMHGGYSSALGVHLVWRMLTGGAVQSVHLQRVRCEALRELLLTESARFTASSSEHAASGITPSHAYLVESDADELRVAAVGARSASWQHFGQLESFVREFELLYVYQRSTLGQLVTAIEGTWRPGAQGGYAGADNPVLTLSPLGDCTSTLELECELLPPPTFRVVHEDRAPFLRLRGSACTDTLAVSPYRVARSAILRATMASPCAGEEYYLVPSFGKTGDGIAGSFVIVLWTNRPVRAQWKPAIE